MGERDRLIGTNLAGLSAAERDKPERDKPEPDQPEPDQLSGGGAELWVISRRLAVAAVSVMTGPSGDHGVTCSGTCASSTSKALANGMASTTAM